MKTELKIVTYSKLYYPLFLFYQSLYESFEVNEMDVGSAIEGRRLPDIFYLFECSAKCEDR